MRVLELFAGIGGCAASLEGRAEVVAAVDISRPALQVYAANFPHPTEVRAVESLNESDFARWRADLWWMSPPCQPYTRRGKGRDLADPRSAGLVALLGWIERLRPPALALENVPEFAGSEADARLRESLDRGGYEVAAESLCPTELGIPNRRRRFYLVASRAGLRKRPVSTRKPRPLFTFLDSQSPCRELALDSETLGAYRNALHIVDADHPQAVTACFTSAYGRSPVRSGSYLRTPEGARRFDPAEILGLLGFPDEYRIPTGISRDVAWRLTGNSLSVPAVRWALSALPELAS